MTLQNPSSLLLKLYFILFFLNFSLSWHCPICKCHSFQLLLYNWLVVFQMVISVLQKSHFHHCRLLSQFCDHVTFKKFWNYSCCINANSSQWLLCHYIAYSQPKQFFGIHLLIMNGFIFSFQILHLWLSDRCWILDFTRVVCNASSWAGKINLSGVFFHNGFSL